MSPLVSALLLGLLQGFTEFLPVSSSGHLVLAQSVIPGFSQPGVLFDITLHLGTLVAVCIYFWNDLWSMLFALFSSKGQEAAETRRLFWLLLVGSLPTAVIGLAFRNEFAAMFTDLYGTGVWFIITGVLLFVTDRVATRGRKLANMNFFDALVIGIAQGLSIIPALSRSGSTIAAGVFLGLERQLLVRYSFLLSIPAIAGAFFLELISYLQSASEVFDPLTYGIGTLVAGIVGYWSIAVLLNMTRSRRLSVFGYYCVAIGALTLFLASQ